MTDACVDLTDCGTSFGAPITNDIVACVISSDSRMVNRPHAKPAGKHLRVVLTWTAVPTRTPVFDNYLSDLDLSVESNTGSKWSTSYNGNVEMVDIPAADISAGGTYAATISLWANRFPASGGISSTLKYAIAWNWVKDHAD